MHPTRHHGIAIGQHWIWGLCFIFSISCTKGPQSSASGEWVDLFNGKDFQNWELYLGIPHDPSLPAESGQDRLPLGIDHDPLGVFKVVQLEGEPAIHVSGEVFGSLRTRQPYGQYHLQLAYKWGEAKWPPRLDLPRDAGLLYHGFGPAGAVKQKWHSTQECQIQQGDTGDYWPIGDVSIEVPATLADGGKWYRYHPTGPRIKQTFDPNLLHRRVLKNGMYERDAAWNQVEIICLGDSSIHIVNGQVVMRLYRSRKIENGIEQPLTEGFIALQSEGAELYYRRIRLRQISRIPDVYRQP